jgi:CubicO group peptidase (beta-lactamase class C family)
VSEPYPKTCSQPDGRPWPRERASEPLATLANARVARSLYSNPAWTLIGAVLEVASGLFGSVRQSPLDV